MEGRCLELKNGGLTAKADPQGGELISLRDGDGVEYIWQGDPASWTGRNPVLFPIVGALKGGETRFNGRTCRMGRHGFARRSVFETAEHTADRVVFSLGESEETLAQFPFPFSLEIVHTLLPDGFSTAYRVRNTGGSPMPFCIGAHTGFRCPLRPGERFEDYKLVFEQPEDIDALPLSGGLVDEAAPARFRLTGDTYPLAHDFFDREDTLILDGLRSRAVSLLHGGTGHGVRVRYDGFPMIAFWTSPHKNAPYICIEPWHGCADPVSASGSFEDKRHCVVLQPGEEKRLCYSVSLV